MKGKEVHYGSLCYEVCKKNLQAEDLHKSQVPEIVEEILKTIDEQNSPDHVGFSMIPSRESLREIIQLVETILYPGYVGEQELDRKNLPYYIGSQMNRIFKILSPQIAKCLMHECRDYRTVCSECGDIGKRVALRFLTEIPKVRRLLAGDVQAAFDGDPAAKSHEEIIFCYPGIQAITIYRMAHELHREGVPILPRMMTEYAHSVTGVDIHPGATIGENFFIDHGTGIVIGETTEIGRNVRIYQGVTLGALSLPKDEVDGLRYRKRHPTIEDDVIIYANATILGGETVIGRGSIIGGNVWITKSVPPHSRVILANQEHKLIQENPAEKDR
jgi:serine O-acetyltransferase